jgi:PAS domain S-box-containing protein
LTQHKHSPFEELVRLFAQTSDPIWAIYDQRTLAFLDISKAAEKHYGYSRADFLRMTILDIRPVEDIPRTLRLTLHPNENRPRTYAVISRHRNKAGDIFEVEVSSWEIVFQDRLARLVIIRDRIPVEANNIEPG